MDLAHSTKCNEQDIETHYNTVKPLVKDINEKVYKSLMLQAINENTAYKLSDNSCFLYYIKNTKYISNGVSFYGKDNPVGMMVLFSYIFKTQDKDTTVIKFLPTSKNEMLSYKSLLTVKGIKNWYRCKKPVVVRVDKIRNKVDKFNDKRFF